MRVGRGPPCCTLPPVTEPQPSPARRLLVAELLSVGTEITVGETRDTNAGEIARSLTAAGVSVRRIQAVADAREELRLAFQAALDAADLVVSTGGLGPTPDDLTREAIADLCGELPRVDRGIEAWLRSLWRRRGIDFPERNLKQAWLIPSATPIDNANGTAPGWWVERPDGRLIIALPGPPREMRPMWHGTVLPRLGARGLGRQQAVRTLRLSRIGESQVAELLGDGLLTAANPVIATYARADAVDVRISAVDEHGRTAEAIVDEAERQILPLLGRHVWARGETTWADAIGTALGAGGLSLATSEAGTNGALVALLGALDVLRLAEVHPAAATDDVETTVGDAAAAVRARTASDVGLAIDARLSGADTTVWVGIDTSSGRFAERHLAFLGGDQGRARAALLAADVLLARLRSDARTRAAAAVAGVHPSEVSAGPPERGLPGPR
jgi:nicotinamide-nucleotide amidase